MVIMILITLGGKKMKIKQLTILLILLFGVISCANEEEENETCGAPTLDGSLQNLSGLCLVDETEHIRLEGVNIPSEETLTIYAFASSATAEDGFKIILRGGASGEIVLDHPTGMDPSLTGQDLTAGNTYCVDLHNEETPIHVLAWSQADCDSSEELESKALFNSEDDVTWNAEDNPTGSSFNYKSSSDRVKVQKIEGREPIFEE